MLSLSATLMAVAVALISLALGELALARTHGMSPRRGRTLDPLLDQYD